MNSYVYGLYMGIRDYVLWLSGIRGVRPRGSVET